MSTVMRTDQVEDLAHAADVMREKLRRLEPVGQVRLEVGVPDLDLLAWLETQNLQQKMYWSGRDRDLTAAGVGVADIVQAATARDFRTVDGLTIAGVRYFGGFRFADAAAEENSPWSAFGPGHFVAPLFEMCRLAGKTFFTCNLIDDDTGKAREKALATLDLLDFDIDEMLVPVSHIHGADCLPEPSGWRRMVENSLEAIGRTSLAKVVLARRTCLRGDEALSPWATIARLEARSHGCYYFAVQPQPGLAFVGASPERLYARCGETIKTEALAGTRPRGNDNEADHRLAEELLSCVKESAEHRFVVDFVRDALDDLCVGTENTSVSGRTQLVKLARVQHLVDYFTGQLRAGVSDSDILEALHPTPAVGGFPRREAMDFIAVNEPFDRGWYAGPVGWVGRDAAEFAVAIRSGLIHDRSIDLFSGAGIVEGSRPEAEWQETENKIENFKSSLGIEKLWAMPR